MGVLVTTAAIVCATALGGAAERRRPAQVARLARRALVLILYCLLPPVIFFNLASSTISLDNGIGLLLGIVALAVAATLTWFVGSRVMHLARHRVGAMVCCVLAINSSYLGYPLTVAILGRDRLPTAVLFDVLVSSPSLLLGAFAVGAAFGTKAGGSAGGRLRAFLTRNPPLYAAILGIIAPRSLAPSALVDITQTLVIAMLPIGFFAVGATLAEGAEHGELPIPPPLTRPVLVTLTGRLLLAPGLLVLLAAPLIHLPAPYLLIAAMPTGINAMVVSHAYGLDDQIVAESIVWSTALVIGAALLSLAF
ncbi:MAG: AEC family transporter [Solirubrobacterales bacterium]